MVFKAFNMVMLALFVLAASVQLNDPDPVVWISLYLLAAMFGVAHAMKRLPRNWPMAFALVAVAWAVTLAPAFLGEVSSDEVLGSVRMISEEAELD